MTTPTIKIPRSLATSALDACAAIGMHDEVGALEKILNQPAESHQACTHGDDDAACMDCLKAWGQWPYKQTEQNQGKPVACASIYMERLDGRLTATVRRFDANQLPVGCLVDLYKYPPASADPGEVDRLREALTECKSACAEHEAQVAEDFKHIDDLRAQLAERDALLRAVREQGLNPVTAAAIRVALSASAETGVKS